MRRVWLHLLAITLLFVGCFVVGRSQPLVRNSLVYARAAWNVVDAGYDARLVVADSRLSYDKPIGFAWLAAPLVARLGAHDGLRVVSLLGTVAYLLATLYLARTLLPAEPAASAEAREQRPRQVIAVLWLAAFGPLVAYQAWSAHPDSWFAALVVTAIALCHRIATGDERVVARRCVLLAATLLAAFLQKNYALILLPGCALQFAIEARSSARAGRCWTRRVVGGGAALLLVGAFIAAARFGWNPWSRLEGEGGGADQYALASIGSIWWKSLAQCGAALLLQFHLLLPLALRRAAWSRATALPWLCFGGCYVAGLLPFPTAFYNMRYFLPLFPLAAITIVRGAASDGAAIICPTLRRVTRAGFTAFALVNATTLLVFNVPALFDAARPMLPDLTVRWLDGGPPLSLLDNLRMEQHRDQAAWLAAIDREVEPGATLYLLDVVYYRDAQQGVFERDGWIRADIATRYASRRDFAPTEPRFWVWSWPPTPPDLSPLGRVTDFGHRLFRVER